MADTLRVLYVDDEPDLLEICKVFLEESGDFIVTTALSAAEGIRLLEQEKLDAIISDYQMPGMDGIQFLVEVRTRFGSVPFILFTGKGREEVVIQAINNGVDFYLQKGGEPGAQFAELSHKVRQAALRNKAEDSLRKSEEKYRQLIEHSNEAILVAQDGMLKLVNHRLIELLGYSEQELLSKQFPVFIHPNDRAMVVERYQKRLKCEVFPSRYPFRLNQKDGNILWVEISAVVIDWDGRPATLNFLTDITERKRAEDALLESRDRSDGILASLDEAIILVDPATRLISMCNSATSRIFGYSHEELIGRATNFLHVDQAHFEQFGRDAIIAYENPGYFATEFEMRRKDGSVFPSEHFVRPIRDPDGRIKYVVSVVRDITERKQAEEKLLEAKARTTTLLEGIADTFYSLDDKWQFITVNPAAEKAPFGRPASELLGRVIWELYPGLVGTFIQQHYFDAAKNYSLEHYEGQSPLNGRWYEVFMQGRRSGVDVYMRDISERKLAEMALRESEEKYRSLTGQVHDGIYIYRGDRFVFTNTRVSEITGYSQEELLTMPFIELVHPDDKAYIRDIAERRWRGESTPERYESRIIRKDGLVRNLEIVVATIPYQDGIAALGAARDITERKQAEESLGESRERYRELVESISDVIFEIDRDGKIIYISPAVNKVLEYEPNEMIGKFFIEFIYPEDRGLLVKRFSELSAAVEYPMDYRVTTKSRKTRWVRTQTKPVMTGGTFCGAKGTLIDITERKVVELELVSARERLKEAHRLAHIGTWDWVIETDTVTWSEELCNIAGWDPAKPAPTYAELPRVYTPASWDVLSSAVTMALTTGETYNLELEMVRPDGSIRWTNAYGGVKRDPGGKITGLHGTVQDITERKKAEEALRESEEQLRGIFNTVSSGIAIYAVRNDGSSGKDYIIKDFNKKALEIEGKKKDEVIGKSLSDLRPAIDDYGLIPIFRKVWNTGVTEYFPQKIYLDENYSSWYENRVFRLHSGEIVAVYDDISDRKQAEEALAASEEKYHTIADFTYDWEYWMAPDGNFIYVSPSCERITGYRPDEFILDPNLLVSITHPDDRDNIIDHLSLSKYHPRDHGILEFRIIPRDGEERWIGHECQPVFNAKGDYLGKRASNRDITERKISEKALKTSQAQLSEAMELAHLVNWEFDVASGLFTFDDRFYAFLGTTAEFEGGNQMSAEVYAKNFVHPDDQHVVADEVSKAIKATDPGFVSQVEHRIIRRDGEVRYIVVRFGITKDENGMTTKTKGANQDITELKRAEEVLRETNEYLNNLFDYANAPIIVWDPGYVITRFNHAFEDLTLLSEQEVIGKRLDILFPKESRDASLLLMKKTLEGEQWETVEIPILVKDGRVLTVLWNSANILDTGGRIISTIAQGVDITKRTELEKEMKYHEQELMQLSTALAKVNRKLNLLSSITRHDINNQLLVLNGFLELLHKKIPEPALEDYFIRITRSSNRISAMIKFTKEYEEIGVHTPICQDIQTLVEKASNQAPLGQVMVKNGLPSGIEVFADPLILRVFYNLMDNAARYGGKITTIWFTVKESGDRLILVCEDDGEGIPADEKEKIFERGFGKNTGMGLFLVREILSITGIAITETGEPGKGARFEMTVPKGAWRMAGTVTDDLDRRKT